MTTTPPTSTAAARSTKPSPRPTPASTASCTPSSSLSGAAPGLGFVHTGHIRSFIYDIADLYKADITLPIAFDMAARGSSDIPSDTRRAVRDVMKDGKFLETCVRDIQALLAPDDEVQEYGPEAFEDVVMLWDYNGRTVAGGTSYDEDT